MNYEKHYNQLIARGKRTIIHGYREKHHVIPRCMGGTNDKENIVELTAREHFVAHQLLVKMYPGNRKLVYALHMMCKGTNKHKRNNRLYEWHKVAISKFPAWNKGVPCSVEQKEKISKTLTGQPSKKKGIPMCQTQKIKISNTLKNGNHNSWNKGLSKELNPNTGRKNTQETKERMRAAALLRWEKQKACQ